MTDTIIGLVTCCLGAVLTLVTIHADWHWLYITLGLALYFSGVVFAAVSFL